jgi:hypothetical protein
MLESKHPGSATTAAIIAVAHNSLLITSPGNVLPGQSHRWQRASYRLAGTQMT